MEQATNFGLTSDLKTSTFKLSDAMKLLDEIKGAKTEKEALVKLSQLLICFFEHSNINQSRIKSRLDKHEWSNKISFIVLTSVVIFTSGLVTVLLGFHMGA